MNPHAKQQRYQRLIEQLTGLLQTTDDPVARMATTASLLYHKMNHFYWVGFYRLVNRQLLVGPYQGTIACQKLQQDTGVCWAAVNQDQIVRVPDVSLFPGHIACDPKSRSEIVIPVRDTQGSIRAVLDGDSDKKNAFDEVDADSLSRIAGLIYSPVPDEAL